MPDNPAELLEWNEENLSKVTTDLYKEAETDQALRDQLMANPFQVLSSRINVPEGYSGGIFAREKGQPTMMLYVPSFGATRAVLPEGTTEAEPPPDYEIVCTMGTLW